MPDNSVCFVLFQYMSTSVILVLLHYQEERRSHRSWGVMTPTFRGKGGLGDIIWE